MEQSGKNLEMLAKVLIGLGFGVIFLILGWVFVAGSWSKTPTIIQAWGHFLEAFSELPFVGGFSLILWGVFVAPGFLILAIADRKQDMVSSPVENPNQEKSYTVLVDDNFHYMDESERYTSGKYKTEEEAILKCKSIIDEYWEGAYEEGMTADQLYRSWITFGEDPFIHGVNFSSSDYAKFSSKQFADLKQQRANETKRSSSTLAKVANSIINGDVELKYGSLLKDAEIIEDDEVIYFCSGYGQNLVAGWEKSNGIWQTSVDRSLLDGLAFSSPKRFEAIAFGQIDRTEATTRKRFLVEYLLNGIQEGDIKTVSTKLKGRGLVEFSFDWLSWNKMLIGGEVGIVDGLCKHWAAQRHHLRTLHQT